MDGGSGPYQKVEVKTGRWRGDPPEAELTASAGVIGPRAIRIVASTFPSHGNHQVDDASRLHDLGQADVPEPSAFHWPLIRPTTAAGISCSRQRLRTFA